MFYHGIYWEYIQKEYPILSPRRRVSRKRGDERMDRMHLLESFGLEPVHLLEESDSYPELRCVRECLAFGDTVLAFPRLPEPMWQLSPHEVGVEVLDLRTCFRIYVAEPNPEVSELFPNAETVPVDSLFS